MCKRKFPRTAIFEAFQNHVIALLLGRHSSPVTFQDLHVRDGRSRINLILLKLGEQPTNDYCSLLNIRNIAFAVSCEQLFDFLLDVSNKIFSIDICTTGVPL